MFLKDITSKWTDVKQLVPKRDQVLQAEQMRQQRNEALRRKFAEKANGVGPWIERQMDSVAAIGMGMQGTLEEQLNKLRQYEQAVVQYRPHMDELEKIHQEVQEGMIFENRYTHYTMEVSLYHCLIYFLVDFYLTLSLFELTDSSCRLGTVIDFNSQEHQ